MVTYETDGQQPLGGEADAQTIIDMSVEAIDELINISKRKLLMNDFSGIAVRVDWFIKEKGLAVDKDSVEYVTLCREILKAEIETLKVEKERIAGNYDNQHDSFYQKTLTEAPDVPHVVA